MQNYQNVTYPLLKVANLQKSYKNKLAISDITFEAYGGKILAILGPNGSGKTTTLACIQGIEKLDSGKINILGVDVKKHTPSIASNIGVMLQDGGLPQNIKPIPFLKYLSKLYAKPRNISEIVQILNIEKFKNTTIRRLSGGEKQKVSLAAAMIPDPKIIFLDEPTANMDPQTKHVVWNIIKDLRSRGVCILITTHIMEEVEYLADDICIIINGKISVKGSPQEIIGKYGGERIIKFVAPPKLDISGLKSLLPYQIVVEKNIGKYEISNNVNLVTLEKTAQWCIKNNILVENLAIQKNNLEDVFLQLAGDTPS